jgi:hypothetical protein
MNRKKQQQELIYKLGLLLSPLQDIGNHPERYDAHSRARVAARFSAEAPKFEMELREFCVGEPGHVYQGEMRKLTSALGSFQRNMEAMLDRPESLSSLLQKTSEKIIGGILAIPVHAKAQIFEAYTPFSTYCAIKDLCQAVSEELTLVDRYLDACIFYRYLRDVPTRVKVRLITWPDTKRSPSDFSEFMDASRLYAAERSHDNYRLVVHEDFHDRWLCCDNQIYSLGGSFKDAGQRSDFTLTKVDPSEENLKKINQLLRTGTELFGPTQHVHA